MKIRKLLGNVLPRGIKNKLHYYEGKWASLSYGSPEDTLNIIGVTGTDGKTTTSTMIYHILKSAGKKVGLITSISIEYGDNKLESGLHVTTPDPWLIPKYLKLMVDSGIKWVVLEVTSHALDQNRLGDIRFERAVFTNITREHLDYHKTRRQYIRAKTSLVDKVKEGGTIIYNANENGAKYIRRKVKRSRKVLLSNVVKNNDAKKPKVSRESISFKFKLNKEKYKVNIPILGAYNIKNALTAIKSVENIVPPDKISKAFESFKGISGRMQVIRKKRPCLVVLDFAHTANGLRNALKSMQKLKSKGGRIIVVFGSAGLRDKSKRKKMGEVASEYADIIIITSEDPRTESLRKINDSILQGAMENASLVKRFKNKKAFSLTDLDSLKEELQSVNKNNKRIFVFDEPSRRSRIDAIEFAIYIANTSDIVITTGKGHEKSMCFGEKEYSWDEVKVIKDAIDKKYNR